MKIQKAIMSVDDNPLYTDFWKPVSKLWKECINIEPVLIYFGKNKLDDSYGTVIYTDPVENIPLYLQTQWARFWYTSTEPDTTFIVSDIDMLPLSKSFFTEHISSYEEDKYLHLNGNHYPLSVCYHVAKGKVFKRCLNLADTFEESMADLISHDDSHHSVVHMGFDRWGLDEAYSTYKILAPKNSNDVVRIPRAGGSDRIDRGKWKYDINILNESDQYIDSHSLRPYWKHKDAIDTLVDLVLKKYKSKEI
jgi:hypothetical protein